MTTKRIENLVKSVNNRLQSVLEFDQFYAALYDPIRSLVEFPWVVQDGQPVEWNTRPYQATSWLLDSIIHSKVARLMEQDFEQELKKNGLEYWPEGDPPKSWLAVPMIVGDRAIGVLVIENRRKSKAFGENGLRVLSSVARQTAQAIENARLVERLNTLYKMGSQLNSRIQLGELAILQLIYEQASELMDTSNLYVALYDVATDTVRFPLMYVDGKTTQVEARSGGKGRTEWIIQNKEPIFNETRAESEAWYKAPRREEYIGQAFASWIGVPMMAGDKVLGVIATYHKTQDYVYTRDDQEILSLMANQAAVAIENARLYAEMEQQVQQRTQEWQRARQSAIAAEKQAAINSVAGELVHKMNNLAGTIPARVKLGKERLDPEMPRDKRLIEILDSIQTDTLNLLEAARHIRESTAPETVVLLDANEIVRIAVARTQDVFPAEFEQIKLHASYFSSPPYIAAPRNSLLRALEHLLHNAVEAMPNGGELHVTTREIAVQDQQLIEVLIADTGVGIRPTDLPKVFDLFFTTKSQGMGFGLWDVKNIIKSIEGDIDVELRNPGTEFRLRIPTAQWTDKDIRSEVQAVA